MAEFVDPRPSVFVETRPWGQFEQLVANQQVTVKIITVEPGHRLSLQRHAQRGEFWHVLDGPVDIQVGDDKLTAVEGDDVWVPARARHRIGNSGERRVRVLEVAFGEFDEADIERIEDDYMRPTD